jgi:hypothetical protein
VHANVLFRNRDQRAFQQIRFARPPHAIQQLGQRLAAQPFNPNADHRRPARPRQSQQGVEVGVERCDHAIITAGGSQYLLIRGGSQPALADVNYIVSRLAKQFGRRTGQSLVQ